MQGTLRRSFKPILSFSILYLWALQFSLSLTAHLCFGAKVNREMSLPCMHIQSWGHCSFFFFLLAILFVLINSFVAVLVDAYCEIREEQGAVFSDVRVGTFMFNFFLNKIKAFHSQIACGKAQLSHKFLSKAPTMGNSHLFLVIVDTFVLNHSKTISSTVLTTKVLNLRMTKAQNLRQIALMNASIPLSCLKL